MKKITALLGFVGVVSMISGCTSDTVSKPEVPNKDEHALTASSSSVSSKKSSSSVKTSGSSTTPKSSSGTSHVDTLTQSVTIQRPNDNYEDPYFSSGIFCWSEECEKAWASSSSVATSSSSISIEVTMSSEAPVYPTVTATQMTDMRDGKTYKLQTIAGMHWMAENLNYATKSNSFCSTASSDDMCAKYGRFYTYAAALSACPTGWRLPTQTEVETLDAAVEHEWWSIGGRFKITDGEATEYGLDDEQGYIWIQHENEFSSFRIKNYSGDSPHEFQSGSVADRAYNVRCIENK